MYAARIKDYLTMKSFVAILAATMSVYHLYTGFLGTPIPEIHYPLHLAFALSVLFLGRDTSNLSPLKQIIARTFDVLITIVVVSITAYLILNAEHITTRMLYVTPLTTVELTLSALMLLCILEAGRRTVGWPLVALGGGFVAYAYFGNWFPDPFWHRGYSVNAIFEYSFFTPEGVFGIPVAVMANYVFHFILFGALLVASGAGDFFTNLARALTGRYTGGPAKASVLASAFMGMLSGSAAANVVTTGSFTIPAMKKAGYKPQFAAGVEAVSSSGGQLAPPILGTAAFIMMEFVGVSYTTVVGISIIPAALYFLGIFLMVDLEARRLGLSHNPLESLPLAWPILKRQGYLLLSIGAMIWILLDGWTPTMAAVGAIATLFVLLLIFDPSARRRIVFIVWEALTSAPRLVAPVVVACAIGGLLVGLIGLTGLGLRLSGIILMLAQGNLLIMLILTMIMGVILGMGMPTSGAYIILAALLAPGLINAGVDILAAHMFIIYAAAKSSITPPVAIASYAAAAVANSDPWKTSLTAFRLGLSVFIIPFMFVYGPALLGLGAPTEIAVAVVTASIGIAALSVACIGWLLVPLNAVERLLWLGASLLMLNAGGETDLLGIPVVLTLAVWTWLRRRRAHRAGPITQKQKETESEHAP